MKHFLYTLRLILFTHLLTLGFLSTFRLVQYFSLAATIDEAAGSVWPALLRGVWFDDVMVCYVQALPVAVLLFASFAGGTKAPNWLRTGARWWYIILYSMLFAISAANIPYFQYFTKNINSSIFEWFGYAGTTVGLVLEEASFWYYIALFIVVVAAYVWLLKRMWRKTEDDFSRMKEQSISVKVRALQCFIALLMLGGCFMGIRGRVGYNPIKISQAYYCNDATLNQLGINPAFNLLTSVLDDNRKENKELALMPYPAAAAMARADLRIAGSLSTDDSVHALRRTIATDNVEKKCNVVFILMESMSADLVDVLANHRAKNTTAARCLTPTLDSLAAAGTLFTHFYSAGIHTNHGITASLYSFPALMFRNLMKGTVTPRRDGLPTILKQRGYHTAFFMTHEAQYDNMNAFFRTNGYDEVFAQEDYPTAERVNAFGVSDRYLFTRGLAEINRMAREGEQAHRPFFATLLTISNHPPYVLPAGETFAGDTDEERIVNYADRCLGEFFAAAKKQPWYENTLFVLVGDHGKLVGKANAELPNSYNHIPLLLLGPGVTPGERCDGLGQQVDIVPTLMALLGGTYQYDGFGKNLFAERRTKVWYSADNQIVGRSERYVDIWNPQLRRRFVYSVQSNGTLRLDAAARPDSLQQYAFSMTQTAELIWQHSKVQ